MTADAWGIPALDLEMQATALVEPVTKWGTGRVRDPMPGTFHFYTDDHKFTRNWMEHDLGRPSSLVAAGPAVAVECNFSTYAGMSRAEALWGIYRKRTLARAWQTAGVRIFVDLNVEPCFRDLALLGVPRGWAAYATKKHRGVDPAEVEAEHALAVAHAGPSDVLFVVFGGGEGMRRMCAERGWAWWRSSRAWRPTGVARG
jgi:hypothetical protein